MNFLVFWPFLTYLPTSSYSITSLFWGYYTLIWDVSNEHSQSPLLLRRYQSFVAWCRRKLNPADRNSAIVKSRESGGLCLKVSFRKLYVQQDTQKLLDQGCLEILGVMLVCFCRMLICFCRLQFNLGLSKFRINFASK